MRIAPLPMTAAALQPTPATPQGAAPHNAARARLDRLARVLDSRWRIPGTGIRFGFDALLDLLPGLGPVATTAASGYIIWEARRLGVPRSMLLRMLGNIGLDAGLSVVPVVGWVGDVFFRANLRNMALLRQHLEQLDTAPSRS